MKRLILAVPIIALSGCVSNAVVHGSGTEVEVSMSSAGIEHIEISGIGELTLQPNDSQSSTLLISGDDNLVERLHIERKGNRLIIKPKNRFPNTWVQNTPLTYALNHNVKSVEISGSADLVADDIAQPSFELDISGSSTAQLGLSVEQLDIDISGSGRIYADGSAQNVELEIKGSGRLYAPRLQGSEADLDVVGSGRVEIGEYSLLDVSAVGSAKVYYSGEPMINSSAVGSATVMPIY
ncbi:head GIN domain-containing protein [Salinibius halmophilus]|uniref:head GIN domain-containing protein n=1 Tax=Salinibius halmophilus TaxID=1853216 RepID=UPI000E66E95C|nr:head GIN domain-containing protein [Salinibius halmophilus]